MSDGPHRTLKMNPAWKRVAEYADNKAYSPGEVADAYLPALEQSCRDEVPDDVWRNLCRIFGDQQRALFRDQMAQEIADLRSQVAGMPLGCSLIDAAVQAASKETLGPEALVEATAQALLNRGARGNKQVEEHWYRKSNEQRTESIRDRLETALRAVALDTLARQRLNMTVAPKTPRSRKQTDLDDGVQL